MSTQEFTRSKEKGIQVLIIQEHSRPYQSKHEHIKAFGIILDHTRIYTRGHNSIKDHTMM